MRKSVKTAADSQPDWQPKKITLGNAIIACAICLILGIATNFINWNSKFFAYLGLTDFSTIDWDTELDEVYSALINNYDGTLDTDALIEGAKTGLVEAVGDEYTVYYSADAAEEFEAELHGDSGVGIGVAIALRDGYVRVTRTLPDNPARKAGILAGDIIYKIDDEEVYYLSPTEISALLKGDAGTAVKLTVLRDDQEITFSLIREEINNVSADISYDGSTAIITTTRFDTDTGEIITAWAANFKEQGINKIILDLRDNGGGYVSAAKDLLSLWIDSDLILVQQSSVAASSSTYSSHGNAVLADIETIVLVNSGTASASEIVAGALQDYGKATILGEQTYGKGVVQTLKYLSDGTLLKVTSAHWFTPNGSSIQNVGITPDIIVENTYDDINHGLDPQLDAAKAL